MLWFGCVCVNFVFIVNQNSFHNSKKVLFPLSFFFFYLMSFWLRYNSLDILFLCDANRPQIANVYYLWLLYALMRFWINRNDLNKTTKTWVGFLQRILPSFTHLTNFILYFSFLFHIPYVCWRLWRRSFAFKFNCYR